MLGGVADADPDVGRAARVAAEDLGRARIRVQEAEEQLERRALPRAVGAEQPGDPLLDLEADGVERADGAEGLRELVCPQERHGPAG